MASLRDSTAPKRCLQRPPDKAGQHWLNKLPFILLTIRTALRDDADISPAQAMYCSSLTLPSDLFQLPDDPYTSYEYISYYFHKLAFFH